MTPRSSSALKETVTGGGAGRPRGASLIPGTNRHARASEGKTKRWAAIRGGATLGRTCQRRAITRRLISIISEKPESPQSCSRPGWGGGGQEGERMREGTRAPGTSQVIKTDGLDVWVRNAKRDKALCKQDGLRAPAARRHACGMRGGRTGRRSSGEPARDTCGKLQNTVVE